MTRKFTHIASLRRTLEVRKGCTMEIRINDEILIPASELHWSFSKSSAPGGQGVNTTDSRVRLSWNVVETKALPDELKRRALERLKLEHDGEISVVAEAERSQLQNRLAALDRMRDVIEAAVAPPPPPRRKTRPTRQSREDRIAEKKHHSEIKRNRKVGELED